MKVFPVILSVVVLGLSVGSWYYSSQQQTMMRAVVNVSGGKAGKGMEAVKKQAESDFNKALLDANSADEKTRKVSNELNGVDGAIEKREVAESTRDEQRDYRDGMSAELEVTKGKHEEAQKKAEALLETMRTLDDLASVSDLTEVVDTFQTIVTDAKEKNAELTSEHASLVEVRGKAESKVAAEQAELARLEEQNRKFEATYRKNVLEYVVSQVKPESRIVVFKAPKDSGIVIGDTVPLIVKRGDVTVANLRVESVKGNEVVAKYTLVPGQEIRVGDNIIHKKPHGS